MTDLSDIEEILKVLFTGLVAAETFGAILNFPARKELERLQATYSQHKKQYRYLPAQELVNLYQQVDELKQNPYSHVALLAIDKPLLELESRIVADMNFSIARGRFPLYYLEELAQDNLFPISNWSEIVHQHTG